MGWSTREIAELADTTVRAVRHYHDVGLLEEPERRSNGYKQYGVAHLVRVLRIKRLTDLGFSLAQIEEMGDADEHPEEALRTLDGELAATIERLQRVRVELNLILRTSAPTDLPPDLVAAESEADLSDVDRSMVVVMTRVLGPQGLKTYADLLRDVPRNSTDAEFEALPAEADEETRRDLAERMGPHLRDLLTARPELRDMNEDAPGGPGFAMQTAGKALKDLYNPAQIDVMRRAVLIAAEPPQT